MDPVVVVGGGFSGLAAGVCLASRGVPVLVLEQKRHAGGRAYSFRDAETGETVDNGQHVLIAGYDRTLEFLETIGSRHLVAVQQRPTLVFHHPELGFRSFTLPKLPPPFHLLCGILACPLFSPRDRLRLLRAGAALRSLRDPDNAVDALTIEQWLDALGQSMELKRSFWEPLAVSIMNEHIAVASAGVFARALRKAFLGNWDNPAVAFPIVGLSELYVRPAEAFIERHRGKLRTGMDVTQVVVREGLASGVRIKDGSTIRCRAVILAVPSVKVLPLLPAPLRRSDNFMSIGSAPVSPILSIHLWYQSEFMRQPMVGLIGRRVQWVFNRRKIMRDNSSAGGHLTAVISAAHAYVGLSNDELVEIAVADLKSVYGPAAAGVKHATVIREKRATFSPLPAIENRRPDQLTTIPNLFVAGDWTATGYPATIEGAVVSAERCADLTCAWLRKQGAVG
jgi:squalene-associated FAD-dependent desaturase